MQTEPVVCGRYTREITAEGNAVGRFVYGKSYRSLAGAVPIDPFQLPLTDEVLETGRLNGVFGAIRDASPDAWGRKVIERLQKKTGLDEIDFLLESPEDRAGALSFALTQSSPPTPKKYNPVIELEKLLEIATALDTTEAQDSEDAVIASHLDSLLNPGTSLGGARPKNVVRENSNLWIAKFPQKSDKWRNAPVEAAMLSLARLCGIEVPETRIIWIRDQPVLLVKRFDREIAARGEPDQFVRSRMVSALTVLQADDSPTDRGNWSYMMFADEIQRWSASPSQDRIELFRRMALNALISNLDDHPRNHALIAPATAWRLAPAYDLTPSPVVSQEERHLAMTCGKFGRIARIDNMLTECARFGLRMDEANNIISETKRIVETHWRAEVLRQGGTEADCYAISTAFSYPGFGYKTN